MKFFIDTANIAEIKEANAMGMVDGVTTNPSLIAKEGGDFKEIITEICGIVDGRLTTCYVLQKVLGPENFRFDVYRNLGYVGPCTKHDMRTITRSSSIALAHSLRLVGPTRFHLRTEPPGAAGAGAGPPAGDEELADKS